jgi:hypothetical protein
MDPSLGDNINGPSLIRVPDWVPNPLGKYYLYFAHHHGKFIRLAYADQLAGPWTIYPPGVLPLEATRCRSNLASPDVHVDQAARQIRMYFHCPVKGLGKGQYSFAAVSEDGLTFSAGKQLFGTSYFRVFEWLGAYYAIATEGRLFRSEQAERGFLETASPFYDLPEGIILRHPAVLVDGDRLRVFYTRIGDDPESILLSTIDLRQDWTEWRASPPELILRPEMVYEGADLPSEPSLARAATGRVNQVRDPAIFVDGTSIYLLYSVAGEQGIAIAELRRTGDEAP